MATNRPSTEMRTTARVRYFEHVFIMLRSIACAESFARAQIVIAHKKSCPIADEFREIEPPAKCTCDFDKRLKAHLAA